MDETGYNNAAAVWDELRHADDGCPLYADDSTDTDTGSLTPDPTGWPVGWQVWGERV